MPFKDWAPAPISGIFGLASNLITNQQNRKREKGRRVYEQAQEYDRRKYDQAMWSKVNKYNHPLQQMERLKNAGLNPNLIYGSSPGSAVGNAQSIATGKQLQGQAPQYQMDNPMIPFMDTQVKQAQSNNLDSLSNLNDVKALTEMESGRKASAEADTARGTVKSNIELQQIRSKIEYQKLLQEELNTMALGQADNGVIARYALGTMEARIKNDSAEYKKNVDALYSYLSDKGITPNSYNWAKIMALIPGFMGKLDFDHKGFQIYKNKQNK
jgi:hypothetical protein